MEQQIAAQVVGLGGVNDFSLWQLFIRADFVVKSVIILLLASSAENLNSNLPTKTEDPLTQVFKDAMGELIKTKTKSSAVQTARVERILEISTDNQIKKIEKNFTFLATVGSTAPFIGLFGTVWGIMNSFQSIAISRNTSLAIVAPGIAEALFATALGLLAAIPAVVAYNKFNSDSKRYVARIENFCKRFLSII